MTWFHSKGGEQQKRPQDPLVSSEEIQSAFTEQRDYLYWVALLISADKTAPEQAVVDGSKLSGFRGGVFRDWLIVWANHATMRTASRGRSANTPTMKCFPAMRSGRFANTTRLGCGLRTPAGRTPPNCGWSVLPGAPMVTRHLLKQRERKKQGGSSRVSMPEAKPITSPGAILEQW
jgi:hypothetical protein